MTKTDHMFTLLTNRYPIITLEGNQVKLSPTGNGYLFNVDPGQGKPSYIMTRREIIDAYANGTLKFYEEASVANELYSALYDWD